MADRKTKDVTVEVDFNGISYDPASNQWTVPPNTPVFNVEKKTKIKAGDNTIIWTAKPSNVQSGFTPSLPGPTGGVAFPASSNWPYNQPNATSALVYSVNDDFATPPPQSVDYPYTITITLTSIANAAVSRSFLYDPEVQNEGPPPVMSVGE